MVSIMNVGTIEDKFVKKVDDDVAERIVSVKINGKIVSKIEYERADKSMWILSALTLDNHKNQGHMTRLVRWLCQQNVECISPGIYLEEGELYLKHVLERESTKKGIKILE